MRESFFTMEIGSYENTPIQLIFPDGGQQSISSYEASKLIVEFLKAKQISAERHEFVGGHNYICYRNSLANRLEEVLDFRLTQSINLKMKK